jgi:phage tail-like protein
VKNNGIGYFVTQVYYHASKFQVVDSENFLNPLAGFKTCTIPEETIEIAEYKEGIWTYSRKQLGNPTFSNVTLGRGIVKNDTTFSDYIRSGAEGSPVRTDFNILHFHRDDVPGLMEYTKANPSRIIRCFNALPTRVKYGGDMDATSSDISLQEIELVVERCVVEYP